MTLELKLYRFGTATDVFPRVGVRLVCFGTATEILARVLVARVGVHVVHQRASGLGDCRKLLG